MPNPGARFDIRRADSHVCLAEEWHVAAIVAADADLRRQSAAALCMAAEATGLALCEIDELPANAGMDFAVLASVLPALNGHRRAFLEVDRLQRTWEGYDWPDAEGRLRTPAAEPLRRDIARLLDVLATAKEALTGDACGLDARNGWGSSRLTNAEGRRLDLARVVCDALVARGIALPTGFAAALVVGRSEEELRAVLAKVNRIDGIQSLA